MFDRLVDIVVRHKSNQSDLSQYIQNALTTICEHYLAGKDEDTVRLLDRLEGIVTVGPHNIHAANALSTSLEKTLIAASVDKITAILHDEVKKR